MIQLGTTNLSSGNQVYIPDKLRAKYGIKTEELMGFFEDENGQLIIKKVNP